MPKMLLIPGFWPLSTVRRLDRPNPYLESGEFCEWPKLNTRGYPCTLGVPPQSVLQKGYPLAQAHCTAFAPTPGLFVWFAPTSALVPFDVIRYRARFLDIMGGESHDPLAWHLLFCRGQI